MEINKTITFNGLTAAIIIVAVVIGLAKIASFLAGYPILVMAILIYYFCKLIIDSYNEHKRNNNNN